jgi:hypothetical protein
MPDVSRLLLGARFLSIVRGHAEVSCLRQDVSCLLREANVSYLLLETRRSYLLLEACPVCSYRPDVTCLLQAKRALFVARS